MISDNPINARLIGAVVCRSSQINRMENRQMLNQYEAVNRIMERYVQPEVEQTVALGNPIDNALSIAIAHVGLDAFEKGDKEAFDLTGSCAPEDVIEEFRFRYPSSEWSNDEILNRADEHFSYHLRLSDDQLAQFFASLNDEDNIN